MKFSTSTIAALSLFVLGASAAPAPKAEAVAVAAPAAAPNAIAMPVAEANANADAEPLLFGGLTAIGNTIASFTGVISTLSQIPSLLKDSQLPSDIIKKILNAVVALVQGILAAVGSGAKIADVTATINRQLDLALNTLDTIVQTADVEEAVRDTLVHVVTTVKGLLTNVTSILLSVIENLFTFNLTGLVTGLLGGVLTTIADLLNSL